MSADDVGKQRAAARGWVTRESRKLQELCKRTPAPSVNELTDAISQFDQRLHKLDEIQTHLELLTDAKELDKLLDEAVAFRDGARVSVLDAQQLLIELKEESLRSSTSRRESSDSDNSVSSSRTPSIRLPKLELPHFSGKYTEFPSFWQQFNAIIHENPDVPTITKYTYLVSLLKGEARDVIKGYEHTEGNYIKVYEELEKRYGREEKIVFTHVQCLLNFGKRNIT